MKKKERKEEVRGGRRKERKRQHFRSVTQHSSFNDKLNAYYVLGIGGELVAVTDIALLSQHLYAADAGKWPG